MTYFLQATALVLVAAILCLTIGKQGKDFSILLTIAVCCMVLILGAAYLEPVLDFLQNLESMGQLDSSLIDVLFKVVGIAMLSEIAGMICTDAGNASMGKALHILGTAVILWLSIPIFNALLELIGQILGEV